MFHHLLARPLVIKANTPAVLFAFGPLVIRWYALAYMAGIIGGILYLGRLIRAPAAPMAQRHVDDLVLWLTGGIILGGRIGHILFYGLHPGSAYLEHPLAMLEIWKGGMSYHGGMIGVTLALLAFSRRHGLEFLRVHDYVAVVSPIGLFFGRLANFFNGELWGAKTTAAWGVVFQGVDAIDTPRHPSQLYEAGLEGLVLFAVLNWLFWKTEARRWPGFFCGLFLLLYGIFRFSIEFIREADADLVGKTGLLHTGQWLCIPMILGGLYLTATAKSRARV